MKKLLSILVMVLVITSCNCQTENEYLKQRLTEVIDSFELIKNENNELIDSIDYYILQLESISPYNDSIYDAYVERTDLNGNTYKFANLDSNVWTTIITDDYILGLWKKDGNIEFWYGKYLGYENKVDTIWQSNKIFCLPLEVLK